MGTFPAARGHPPSGGQNGGAFSPRYGPEPRAGCPGPRETSFRAKPFGWFLPTLWVVHCSYCDCKCANWTLPEHRGSENSIEGFVARKIGNSTKCAGQDAFKYPIAQVIIASGQIFSRARENSFRS